MLLIGLALIICVWDLSVTSTPYFNHSAQLKQADFFVDILQGG